MKVEEYFKQLRFDKKHHLGLGDIRLTIAQQDEILDIIQVEKEDYASLKQDELIAEIIQSLKEGRKVEKDGTVTILHYESYGKSAKSFSQFLRELKSLK